MSSIPSCSSVCPLSISSSSSSKSEQWKVSIGLGLGKSYGRHLRHALYAFMLMLMRLAYHLRSQFRLPGPVTDPSSPLFAPPATASVLHLHARGTRICVARSGAVFSAAAKLDRPGRECCGSSCRSKRHLSSCGVMTLGCRYLHTWHNKASHAKCLGCRAVPWGGDVAIRR